MASSQTTTVPTNGSIKAPVVSNDRRHSSFHPQTTSTSRTGSTSSSRKGSDTPSWLTAMNERNNSIASTKEERKGSVVGELKGLFGRKKSKDTTPKPKVVITSKYANVVRNKLKTDVRIDPSRRKSTGSSAIEKAQIEGPSRSSVHITAKEQEERHPHSGPVGHGAPLTTIISHAEGDPEQHSIASALQSREDVAHQPLAESDDETEHPHSELAPAPRKKSVTEVEFKPAERRPRKKSMFGGWYRDDTGKWTR